MKHMKVSPTEKKNSSHWVKKRKRFLPCMYKKKKKLVSLKIPTPPPHDFSNGPSPSRMLVLYKCQGTAIHIASFFFHGRSIFWKTLLVSLPSLLDFLTIVLIFGTGDCNVDISEQLLLLYQVKVLVLCRISTTVALCPTEILTVYAIMLVIRSFP